MNSNDCRLPIADLRLKATTGLRRMTRMDLDEPGSHQPPAPSAKSVASLLLLCAFGLPSSAFRCPAVIFTNNARVEVNDSTGGVSWNPGSGALTVSCWFKLSIPSGVDLAANGNMTILVNRRTGTESDNHAYLIRFNVTNGNIEFTSKGSAGTYLHTLIERPFLDRWYHVAIARQGDNFTCYIAGRLVPGGSGSAGDASANEGLSVGGWSNAKYLFGEVQEVAVYQSCRDQEFLANYLFQEQPTNDPSLNLKAYYKLSFSTNAADSLRNFAPSSVPAATIQVNGGAAATFEEVNQAGEQSAFDSRKNGGRDALVPLSGSFSWNQTAVARPTPGVAFDLRVGYGSANAFGVYKLNTFDPYASGPLGKGWRHTFEARVLPSQSFSPLADTDTLGVLAWDGSIETWDKDQTTLEYKTRSKEYRGEFLLTTTNCQWTTPERLVYTFKLPNTGQPTQMRGRLLSIRDFNGNDVQVR